MKLEIKTKCTVCEHTMEPDVERLANYTILHMSPCLHCHPAKPEKVTPKEGEEVEVRNTNFAEGTKDTRRASGERRSGLVVVQSPTNGFNQAYDQWRYPGESDDEWKD